MHTTNFSFLETDYPELAKLAQLAERNCYDDPSTTLSKLRILTEKLAKLLISVEYLEEPYDNRQVSRLQLLQDQTEIPREIISIFHTIRKSGNKASHEGVGTTAEAVFMLKKTFQLTQWFFEVYEYKEINTSYQKPDKEWFKTDNSAEITALETALEQLKDEVKLYQEKAQKLQLTNEQDKQERKERSKKQVKKLTETEAETRERIDQQLRTAGWECDSKTINYRTHKTLPEKGKNKAIAEWKCGNLWADYALFIGNELVGLVEAKKHSTNVMSTLEQTKEYSTAITQITDVTLTNHSNSVTYKIPFLFATNGRDYLEQLKTASGIWFWDARNQKNIARPIRNWFTPNDLKEKLLFNTSVGEEKLQSEKLNYLQNPDGLNLRNYQVEAIKSVEHKIVNYPQERKSLLAMATGTGKTRTIIGMAYRLIKSGTFNRVLFLVDRRMLGKQATDAFKEVAIENLQTFADIYDVKDLENISSELDTKIHFATVQSMVKRVAYSENPPSIGEYDCIIVDEAHRGYTLDKEMDEEELILRDQKDFQSKYRMVLDYFDAYRIGLTATPASHTAEIFGHPVFTYSYRQAVIDGYLIDFEPPYVFKTKLSEEGIVWEKGDMVKVYDPEENTITETGVTDDEIKIEVENFNRKVINDSFNRNIIRALISDYGLHPEDPKKTIIFAVSNAHADQIVKILYEEFEEFGETVDVDAIKKITGDVYNREDLLRRYKNDQYPSIVVTVDLLTTGIDVPAICNIVFLRKVKSRILFDQMMGRATRKCDDIGKTTFKVYDCVGVTEEMAKEKVMKPVAPLVTKTFVDLTEELFIITNNELKRNKLDRIIAKLQIKLRSFTEEQNANFLNWVKEEDAQNFVEKLKNLPTDKIDDFVAEKEEMWQFLDRQKNEKSHKKTLFSEHEDQIKEVTRAYEKNLKPKDYIESFTEYINQHKNTISALHIICTKPSSLTRKALKELQLILDENGYNKLKLNTAYKQVKNQDIVADIIAHIRTAALGMELIAHDKRIKNAVKTVKENHQFNKIQEKWLDKIENQLLQENVITVEDLNQPPFSIDGGKKRLDKIFKTDVSEIIEELNQYLYG